MPFTPEQLREHRRKLRERGICLCCHKRETGGKAVCPECCELNTKSKKKIRADKTRCSDCGNRLDDYSKGIKSPRCMACTEKRLEARRRLQARRS